MSDYYVVESDSLSSIADAIREKTGKDEQLEFPDDFVSQIQDIESQGGIYVNEEPDWVRPVEWPDLDALLDADEADDVIYYTVDNTDKDAWFSAGITTNPVSAKKNLERGHIEDGVFIVDEIKTTTNNSNMIFSFSGASEWVDYPVFRLTYETGTWTNVLSNSNVTVEGISTNQQRMKVLEIACKFTGEVAFQTGFNKYTVQKVRIDGGKIKSLSFQDARDLREINAQDWDVSQMTTMQTLFSGCKFLKEVKCENWDVKKVTSFYETFAHCYRLKNLDLSKWQNNIATTYYGFIRNCQNLKEINFGLKLDTSNVTNLSMFCQNCFNLKKLDISWMNTSKVQTFSTCFDQCLLLKEIIGLSHIDTSAVTKNGGLPSFRNCRSLSSLSGYTLNLSSLTDTINNNYMFAGTGIIELDLSNQVIHSEKISAPFLLSDNYFLKKIDYHGLDTSGITGFHSFWVQAENVQYVNLNEWDFTHLTTISNIWNRPSIKQYWPPKISINHSYNQMYGLDHASKLRILNILPEVSETRTLTLGPVRTGLTPEEIVIATQKGWTVA